MWVDVIASKRGELKSWLPGQAEWATEGHVYTNRGKGRTDAVPSPLQTFRRYNPRLARVLHTTSQRSERFRCVGAPRLR